MFDNYAIITSQLLHVTISKFMGFRGPVISTVGGSKWCYT